MVASVKAQLKLWLTDPGLFAFNTGPKGKLAPPIVYADFTDIVTGDDFNAACKELYAYVKETTRGTVVDWRNPGRAPR